MCQQDTLSLFKKSKIFNIRVDIRLYFGTQRGSGIFSCSVISKCIFSFRVKVGFVSVFGEQRNPEHSELSAKRGGRWEISDVSRREPEDKGLRYRRQVAVERSL